MCDTFIFFHVPYDVPYNGLMSFQDVFLKGIFRNLITVNHSQDRERALGFQCLLGVTKYCLNVFLKV